MNYLIKKKTANTQYSMRKRSFQRMGVNKITCYHYLEQAINVLARKRASQKVLMGGEQGEDFQRTLMLTRLRTTTIRRSTRAFLIPMSFTLA
jgi:hypothetical protein